MKIIAIDTASSACSAAVADEKGIIAHFECASGKPHSLDFLPGVAAMLEEAGLQLSDMDAVAVTIGPGSFTGIRIGLATAKAWGQALHMPIIPVITLDALSYDIEGVCCPVLDARKNEVYTAVYRDGKLLGEYRAVSPSVLCDNLKQLDEPVCFTGDAAAVYADLFEKELGEKFIKADDDRLLFMAAPAALLAHEKLLQGETVDALELDAFYLRVSEAEQKRMQKND